MDQLTTSIRSQQWLQMVQEQNVFSQVFFRIFSS